MARYSPLELADAFIRTGELADALDALTPYLEVNPDDDAALRLRAAVLMRLPGEGHARAALADLQRLKTPVAEDFVQQSIIWQVGLGDWQQAVAMTERAYRLAPHDERTAERLLMLYEQVGDIHKAQALLTEQPQNWRWLQLAGNLALKTHNYVTAIETYTQALDHLSKKMNTEHNPIVRNIMGMIVGSRATAYLEVGQFEAAQVDFQATADVFKTDLSYSMMVGVTLALKGQMEEAITLCRSVLQNDPQLITLLHDQASVRPSLMPLLAYLNI